MWSTEMNHPGTEHLPECLLYSQSQRICHIQNLKAGWDSMGGRGFFCWHDWQITGRQVLFMEYQFKERHMDQNDNYGAIMHYMKLWLLGGPENISAKFNFRRQKKRSFPWTIFCHYTLYPQTICYWLQWHVRKA